MNPLESIKTRISEGDVDKAIDELARYLSIAGNPDRDEAYYLLGNAHRKKGDWQQALDNYQSAIDLNPESPAAHARNTVMDILNFYNKDMYNQ